MNHGIHYVSNCWTFVFVSHCILPDRCTAEVNAQMHDHCQSTCRLLYPMFFQHFFIACDPQMYIVGGHLVSIWAPPRLFYHNWFLIPSRTPIIFRFGHRPRHYTHNWLLIRPRTPIRSRFGHRPRHYTTIDFWSDLEHPSDLGLVTTHAIIPQLTSNPVSHTHQMPRVV